LSVLVPAASAPAATDPLRGTWVGTYSLGGPGRIGLTINGNGATVALGTGHATAQTLPLKRTAAGFRVVIPGRPAPIVLDGRVRSGRLTGTVRQSVRGTFEATRGSAAALTAPGFYAAAGGHVAIVEDPYGPARLVDLDSGEVHALYARGASATFEIGSGFATRTPVRGTASFAAERAVIAGARAPRLRMRQLEVRIPARNATLSGTLTLPTGRAPYPAVAFVHGSGPTERAYLPDLQALLVRSGVAVLAYDKRGIGQSSGSYPGESPTAGTIDVLARDASAAVHFLAAQPEIDRARIGLAGHSQAGWIMPLAASRDPAVRFLISFSGPAATAGENDTYQDLTGQGEQPPRLTPEQIDAEVARGGRSGVDPVPWIKAAKIPMLWVYGGLDQHIPARLSVRRLEPVAAEDGRELEVKVFPNANHALVETRTGLTSEMLRSNRFAPGLFPAVRAWLGAHRVTS
jgi:dienelactone hydrolase